MILLYILLSLAYSLIVCKASKKYDRSNGTLLKNQTCSKTGGVTKSDGPKKSSKSMNETCFNKQINPPQSALEEQMTQKSFSIKINHDDDTLKNVESLKVDNFKTTKLPPTLEKEIKIANQ
uniref:Uncharacterized protein n=1 Tax=Parastrongyloides trichosuri TaxID=131310 RepID=A0A0N4Z6F5_PARTI